MTSVPVKNTFEKNNTRLAFILYLWINFMFIVVKQIAAMFKEE